MQWRDMTPEEIATRPEARLGGSLAWMLWIAVVAFAVPTVGVALAFAALYAGGVHSNPAGYMLDWLEGPYQAGTIYMIPVGFFMAWSLLFVVMTLARARVTPLVASIGVIAWVALRAGLAYIDVGLMVAADQNVSLGSAFVRSWPFAMAVLAEAALAAGFCGYMATAIRPNAYYRRRLPV
jgi:hypothetical protein